MAEERLRRAIVLTDDGDDVLGPLQRIGDVVQCVARIERRAAAQRSQGVVALGSVREQLHALHSQVPDHSRQANRIICVVCAGCWLVYAVCSWAKYRQHPAWYSMMSIEVWCVDRFAD